MAEEQENTQASAENKKNKTILFVIIGVGVLLILLLAVIIALVFVTSKDNEAKPQQPQVQQTAQPQTPKIVVGNTVTARATDYAKVGPIFPIAEEFRVNLMTQTGKKVLITKINLELDKPETQPEIESKLPMLTDAIIEILASKSFEEVATTKGKNRLKDEIVQRLNEFLIDGSIKNIFFTSFLIG
ncbi:flagellar basal body-associated protein FliL [Helicobacter himalayensis]|uniref:flagellar basal body-associated protein FliL n=1 Tax=Helicobacter himalayensis TaxID=1591088 RepID=UPI00082DD684|nr:flagellar basal body-associated protein FliL [Helicobacter himalayensis]